MLSFSVGSGLSLTAEDPRFSNDVIMDVEILRTQCKHDISHTLSRPEHKRLPPRCTVTHRNRTRLAAIRSNLLHTSSDQYCHAVNGLGKVLLNLNGKLSWGVQSSTKWSRTLSASCLTSSSPTAHCHLVQASTALSSHLSLQRPTAFGPR